MRKYETIDDAKLLVSDILSESLDPNLGCSLIEKIAAKLGYPEPLEGLVALAHEQGRHGGRSADDCVDDIFLACQQLLTVKMVNR